MSTERWLPIPGWEGIYSISDFGRIKSHARTSTSRWGTPLRVRERIMKLTPDADGYLRTTLCRPELHQRVYAHILVLEVFVGPRPFDNAQACHSDGSRANNRLDNLRWGTVSDNALDKVRHGTHPQARRTHCPQGHEYAGPNLRVNAAGRRECRTCGNEAAARSRARLRAAS